MMSTSRAEAYRVFMRNGMDFLIELNARSEEVVKRYINLFRK